MSEPPFNGDLPRHVWVSFLASDEENYDPVDETGLVEPCYDEPNEYETDPMYSATFMRW